MTVDEQLLDEFTKAALIGIVSNPESGCNSPNDLAHYSYQVALAMIKHRDIMLLKIKTGLV